MSGVSAILTAAGESTRMGSPKPLLSWKGTTLVEYQVRCLLDAGCSEVVVVLGHAAEMVEPHVVGEHVRHVLNPLYRQGKTTSIKAGLGVVSDDADGILLLAVDQPRTADVTALSYCQVLALFARDFNQLLDANPDLRERIERIAEERLAQDRNSPD